MGTSTGFEVDLDFTVVGGKQEKLLHTDVHKLLSEEHQHFLLTKTLCPSLRTQHDSAHLVVFQIYSTFEGDTSFCIPWNILAYQVSLVAPGSKLKEGRGNFVFQHRPETADGCTS